MKVKDQLITSEELEIFNKLYQKIQDNKLNPDFKLSDEEYHQFVSLRCKKMYTKEYEIYKLSANKNTYPFCLDEEE